MLSMRSRVRAWTTYAAISYVALTVTVVGLTLEQLARHTRAASLTDVRSLFVGRGVGALTGTLLGGVLCDRLPIKQVVGGFIGLSAAAVASVPLATTCTALTAVFFVVGLAGSALVVCTSTSACWAFPGGDVGPVFSRAAAAFGISAATLPFLLAPVRTSLPAQYLLVSAAAAPALALLWVSEAPLRPMASPPPGARGARGRAAGAAPAGGAHLAPRRASGSRAIALAIAIACAQALLQGSIAGLTGWVVSFGTLEWSQGRHAPMLMSAFQGASTVGCLVVAHFQHRFDLLRLTSAHLVLAVGSVVLWLTTLESVIAGYVAIACYGFFAAPAVGFCSALYSSHAVPSGVAMSILSLGINAGANFAPWAIGLLMSRHGPVALVYGLLAPNAALAVLFCALLALRAARRARAARREARMRAPLLPRHDPSAPAEASDADESGGSSQRSTGADGGGAVDSGRRHARFAVAPPSVSQTL